MKVLISGGGTGGHIYPALAFIEDLKKKDPKASVLYVGSNRGLEKEIVPNKGINFMSLEIQGFKRSLFTTYNLKTISLFLKSVKKAKKIIKDFQPDVAMGTGGYVSGAVLYAASKSKIPTIIHEQNSLVGLTNKFLSHYVNKVAISFEDARSQFPAKKVVFTGNPRAQEVVELAHNSKISLADFNLKQDVPTVLIFGGSQGAWKINEATLEALNDFKNENYQILFVTGKKRYQDVKRKLNDTDVTVPDNVSIVPYLSDMPQVLPHIDLILGRSGATSLAEITALGIPSILIPSPNVTADHQTKNALSLVDNNAALMISEPNLNRESLIKNVNHLMHNKGLRDKIASNAKEMGVPDAADRLLKVVKDVVSD